ncbi:hypothetical protein D3C75_1071150 [compost metagenome]
MRNIVVRNRKGEADTGINGDPADQRDQALMAFAEIGFIHQPHAFRHLAGEKQKAGGEKKNTD